jgi:DNA-binding winged helix-turn-helix (wHTH) protein
MRYFFEDCALDTDRRELRRGPDLVPTTPQVLDLLEYLIRSRGSRRQQGRSRKHDLEWSDCI